MSVTAAPAITPSAAAVRAGVWPSPSATQNSPPSGSRDRLIRFGSDSSGARSDAGDILPQGAYLYSTIMGEPDEIVRSIVRDRSIRVVTITSTGVAREAARRHAAGVAGAVALSRGLTAGLLLATLTKDEER